MKKEELQIVNDLQIIKNDLAENGVDIFHDDYPHFHPHALYEVRGFGMDKRGAVYCAPERVEGKNLVVRLFGRGEYSHLTNCRVSVPTKKVRWYYGIGRTEWTYKQFGEDKDLDKTGMSASDFAATYPKLPFYD